LFCEPHPTGEVRGYLRLRLIGEQSTTRQAAVCQQTIVQRIDRR
jgi:hypothetical protein